MKRLSETVRETHQRSDTTYILFQGPRLRPLDTFLGTQWISGHKALPWGIEENWMYLKWWLYGNYVEWWRRSLSRESWWHDLQSFLDIFDEDRIVVSGPRYSIRFQRRIGSRYFGHVFLYTLYFISPYHLQTQVYMQSVNMNINNFMKPAGSMFFGELDRQIHANKCISVKILGERLIMERCEKSRFIRDLSWDSVSRTRLEFVTWGASLPCKYMTSLSFSSIFNHAVK